MKLKTKKVIKTIDIKKRMKVRATDMKVVMVTKEKERRTEVEKETGRQAPTKYEGRKNKSKKVKGKRINLPIRALPSSIPAQTQEQQDARRHADTPSSPRRQDICILSE